MGFSQPSFHGGQTKCRAGSPNLEIGTMTDNTETTNVVLGPDPHTGIWGGGYLPKPIVDSYVRGLGGIPPKRRLLSQKALAKLLRETGFLDTGVAVPTIPEGQRSQYGKIERMVIDL